ncbi:hypothetical protein [Streptomyces sp. CA-210063]|uniref:hypothetical protein n=1 Tax=Streptomyces sp. CA-210063 TaxID=2801029 RepID=UPI0027D44D87|nr:hypothetical protein [Streptomyces sp. CA-210063]
MRTLGINALFLDQAATAPGPPTRHEGTTMPLTSALIPPAATWHRLSGPRRHRDVPSWREVAA